jgi:hypothetical protein
MAYMAQHLIDTAIEEGGRPCGRATPSSPMANSPVPLPGSRRRWPHAA